MNRWAMAAAAGVASMMLAGASHAEADPARVAAAKELVAAMGGAKQIEASIAQLREALSRDMGEREPAKAKEFADYLQKETSPESERIKTFMAAVEDTAADFYAERFSAEELTAIAAFQKSEAGRKFQEQTPKLAAILGPRLMEFQKKLIEDLQIALNQPQWPGKPDKQPQ